MPGTNIKKRKLRSAYSRKTRHHVALQSPAIPSRAKQSFKDECDINQIMARYQTTGAITHFAKHGGNYQENSSLDFHQAVDLVLDAQNMFNELPSSIRGKFHNQPAEFLEFVQNPDNADEMITLGLREKPIPTSGPKDERPLETLSEPPASSEAPPAP